MELNKIESLAEILNEKNLTAIEVQEGDLRIRLENNNKSSSFGNEEPFKKEKAPIAKKDEAISEEEVTAAEGIEVPSPLVGVVYLAPSPESEPFVTVGQQVEKGDVLCLIEAMKMLNEIAATQDGIITEISVENGAVVDFGTCLFRIG